MLKTFKELATFTEAQIDQLKADALKTIQSVNVMPLLSASMKDEPQHQAFDGLRDDMLTATSDVLKEAMVQGYTTELQGRSEIAQGDKNDLEIAFTVDDSDRAALFEVPVLGHQLVDIILHLSENLQFDMKTVLTGPDRGAFHADQLPENINQKQQAYARLIANQLTTVYLVGAQAAREHIKGAINAS